jgi:Tripartite tricarboxylate transporter TctB family
MNQTMAGGLFLIGLGGLALLLLGNLSFGSLAEIGPAFFPSVAATVLAGQGVVMVILGAREAAVQRGEALTAWALRPMIAILGAIIAFGITIRGIDLGGLSLPPLGLAVAGPLAIMIGGFADTGTRWRELVPFALGISAFCILLFRFALGLPIPLAPWLIGY